MTSPIFIVGANRSGTTLLRLILNAHSRIAVPEELRYLHSKKAGVPIERWRSPGLSEARYERLVDRVVGHAGLVMPGLDPAEAKAYILSKPERDLKQPYEGVLTLWARAEGKERWGEKTPGNLFYADILIQMFPDARFLYIVRDPRGGVNSMLDTDFFTGDVVFNALTRMRSGKKGRGVLLKHVPEAQRFTLRFEDLVSRPEPTIRRVCDFLGEPFEPAMLRFHVDAQRYMQEDAAEEFNAKATRPISADSADRWRTALSDQQIAVIEHICRGEMEEFGYEPVGVSLSPARRLELLVKHTYWNWQCWRRRGIRHYYVNYPIFAGLRHRLRTLGSSASPDPAPTALEQG